MSMTPGVAIMKEMFDLFRICIDKGTELTSQEEVKEVFTDTLAGFIAQSNGTEKMLDTVDMYEAAACIGYEWNCDEFYKHMDNVFAAECLIGEGTIAMSERAIEIMLAEGIYGEEMAESRRKQHGYIWYYVDAIIREMKETFEVLGGTRVTVEYIKAFILFLVVHERRHATQSVGIFADMDQIQVACASLRDGSDKEAYFNLSHEMDANAAALSSLQEYVASLPHLSE